MKKRMSGIVLMVVLSMSMSLSALAHPGRTDANGGHYNRKTGEYHYHNGGGSSSSSGGSSSSGSSGSSYTAPKYTGPTYATKVNATSVPKSINVGDKTQLKASVYPADAEDDEITWSSETPEVATVTESGEVVAVGIGTAKIKAQTSRGTSALFEIEIKEIVANKIEIKGKIADIVIGDEKQLSVAFTPENTTYKNIEWKSENEEVITIDKNGKLTGVAVGTTTIIAKHKELTDSFNIEVKPIKAKKIEIELVADETTEETDEGNVKLEVGKEAVFIVNFEPVDTTDKTVVWSSSDTDVVTIDENGTIKGIAKGTATITAKAENGITDTYEVEVYKDSIIVIFLAAIICIAIFVSPIALIVWLIMRKKRKNK